LEDKRFEMNLKNQKGFTLIELVVVTAIIGIVVTVAVPQYNAYKNRAYDVVTQSVLRSVFTACKDFWIVNNSMNACMLTTVSNTEYGFTPSTVVEVTIDSDPNNTEYEFYATASHTSSPNVFEIDFTGTVSKINTVDEVENNGNDGNGNNGNGCIEEAQNDDPLDLGQNAKGGCGTAKGKKGKKNGGKKGKKKG
jgi:type IV pilus assembly protein PilA